MLEENVCVAPGLAPDAFAPVGDGGAGVFGAAEAKVAPGRGGVDDGVGIGDFVGVGGAESGVAVAEDGVDLVVEPRVVTELECDALVARKDLDELTQLQRVFARKRRELKEERAELVAER